MLYRIKRGLSGYVSYLAACEMNASFSEYVLYEPILRILTARNYSVECVGCSHSGIEAILEAASAVDPRTEIVFGGLHLVTAPTEEIDALVENLKTKWKVQRVAPGHCTGEPAFARLKKVYESYLYAGLGTTLELK